MIYPKTVAGAPRLGCCRRRRVEREGGTRGTVNTDVGRASVDLCVRREELRRPRGV